MIEPPSVRVSAVLVVMVLQSDADVDVDVHDCRTRRAKVDPTTQNSQDGQQLA